VTSFLELAAVKQGQALLELRRAEYRFNHPGPKPPIFINRILPELQAKVIKPQPIPQVDEIRFYPLILLAAIRSKQDIAARLWFIARHLDCGGAGWIYKAELQEFLQTHNVGERQRRRWIIAALANGLLSEDNNYKLYRITGVRAGAEILGADRRGYPILIPTRLIFKHIWHPSVWNGYLATRGNNPISQVKLAEITGVSARTQKKYQHLAPVNKIRNYCQTDLDQSHLIGMRENGRPSAFVGYKRKIYFRLPDNISVPESMAKRPPKRASVKVDHNRKKTSTFLDAIGQEKSALIRLFHQNEKSARSALRKLARDDRLPWNKTQELFIKKSKRQNHNVWTMLPTQ
jgi:hypothetical protein